MYMANIKKCILLVFEHPLPTNISRPRQKATVHAQLRSMPVAMLVITKRGESAAQR